MFEAWSRWTEQGPLAYPLVRAGLIVVGSLVLAKVVDVVICRSVARLARRTRTDLDERLVEALHRPIFITVVLAGLHAALLVLDPGEGLRRFTANVIQTVSIIVWTVALLRVCSTVLLGLSRLSERVSWIESRTLPLFENVSKLVILGGASYFLLLAWNLDVGAWLASAGIVGIAVGFAAKDTLANLFGGLFVIADAPYKLGDFITLDTGERGEVTNIGLRSTRLLTRDDVEITLPNAQIANAKIVNESGGPSEKFRVAVSVGVAYGSDVDRVRAVMLAASTDVEGVASDPEPRVRFTAFGDSALDFRLLCWIVEPVRRGRVLDALNTAVYKRFQAEGISIPFPQREVLVRRED